MVGRICTAWSFTFERRINRLYHSSSHRLKRRQKRRSFHLSSFSLRSVDRGRAFTSVFPIEHPSPFSLRSPGPSGFLAEGFWARRDGLLKALPIETSVSRINVDFCRLN